MNNLDEAETTLKTKRDLIELAERFDNQAFSWDITEKALEVVEEITRRMRNWSPDE